MLASPRYYKADAQRAESPYGSIWVEADGKYVCRQFAVGEDHAFVAPYDIVYLDEDRPDRLFQRDQTHDITLSKFESLWEKHAQRRLHALSTEMHVQPVVSDVLYVRSPFPAAFKGRGEPSSEIFTEWAGKVPRRHFEVFPDHTEVAPYDASWPLNYMSQLRAIQEGLDEQSLPIPVELRPVRIEHREFETLWASEALPRLREIAASTAR